MTSRLKIVVYEPYKNYVCVILVVCVTSLIKCLLAQHPHSGESCPPTFGDYEAQRHWMEITYNLPIKQWYHNSSSNDLNYWGLDYPPLTGYHSYFMGALANKINSSWIQLFNSRGEQSYKHKFFMRSTVFLSDLFIYCPAMIFYALKLAKTGNCGILVKCANLFTILVYPGILLIDFGHFQYNCVSLGLFLWSVIGILLGKDVFASILFVCALNYKQMQLFHSLPFFCYLLGLSFKQNTYFKGFLKLISIGIAVIGTFLVIWIPFLTVENCLQVLSRIFPVARGIFEDKVSNFWCASSILIKWKVLFSQQTMTYISAITTLLMCFPSCLMLLFFPTRNQFKYSLVICSLAFFLFSFQVHEKTILLVSIPVLLILNEETLVCCWFLIISIISLYPLIVKDGLCLSFYSLTIVYYIWISDLYKLCYITKTVNNKVIWNYSNLIYHFSILGGLFLCVSSWIFDPPKKLPDLFTMINCIYCCAHFIFTFLYFNYKQFIMCNYMGFKQKIKVS